MKKRKKNTQSGWTPQEIEERNEMFAKKISEQNNIDESSFSFYMWFKGLFMICLYFYNIVYYKENYAFLDSVFGSFIAGMVVYVICFLGGIYLLLFRGYLNMGYAKFGQIDSMWTIRESFLDLLTSPYDNCSNDNNQYKNINRVNEWVNAKSKFQTREDASETMLTINSLNSMQNTEQGKRVLGYLDSKMNWMTREEGFELIKSKLSK